MILKALNSGRNVLVDGSLRDSYWYYTYITNLRLKYPKVKVAIIYISCKIETALRRAENRALITGRLVPKEIILESYRQIDHSVEILSPITSFVARFSNEENNHNTNTQTNSHINQTMSYHPKSLKSSESTKTALMDDDDEEEEFEPQLLYASIHENDLLLENDLCILPTNNWKELFRNIWKMNCISLNNLNIINLINEYENNKNDLNNNITNNERNIIKNNIILQNKL